ncbi:MAG: hypothetical protein KJ718_01765 [Nanoarchaeota archaeon]|nr:hypothetical protein [Nanoarchaeota archaeon]MBU1051261.1 hypothetical protein [Nanoarchaeota archaeon]MBU1988619.1 hypothetical protein [Nanoarchaeota archaeon]
MGEEEKRWAVEMLERLSGAICGEKIDGAELARALREVSDKKPFVKGEEPRLNDYSPILPYLLALGYVQISLTF